MAGEVVFESERYAARRRRNRWLIPLIGILGVFALTIALVLILDGGKAKVYTGGEDTPYPYTWTVNKKGDATLEIDCSAAPGYVWRAENEPDGMTVAAAKKEKESKSTFTLTPMGAGRTLLSFALQGSDDPDDRIYEMDFLTETVEGKKGLQANPLSVSGHPLQGVVRGGMEGGFPYVIRTDADGDLCIALTLPKTAERTGDELIRRLEAMGITEDSTNEEVMEALDKVEWGEEPQYDWDADSSDEGVASSLGVIEEETEGTADEESGEETKGTTTVIAFFRPGAQPGTVTLRLYDSLSGVCVTAECENGAGGLFVQTHAEMAG